MKLKDLNPQPGQVYWSPTKGTAVITVASGANCCDISGAYLGWKSLACVYGDDWQLLAPVPQLGEALMHYDDFERFWVLDVDGALYPGVYCEDGQDVVYLDKFGIRWLAGDKKVYADPRPLPSLPEPPSLREKIRHMLNMHGVIPGPGHTDTLLNDLVALLESERKS